MTTLALGSFHEPQYTAAPFGVGWLVQFSSAVFSPTGMPLLTVAVASSPVSYADCCGFAQLAKVKASRTKKPSFVDGAILRRFQ
jgi:hypothetical protein